MKYKIKINYDTGDSVYRKTDITEYLEEPITCLETAKQNLKRIEEHYRCYLDQTSSRLDYTKSINTKKDWFVSKNYWERELFLLNDEREKINVSVFWTGWGTSLNYAEIELDNTDMRISFDGY